MTKKHFEAIASILQRDYRWRLGEGEADEPQAVVLQLAHQLADYFAEVSPDFDRARFYGAIID